MRHIQAQQVKADGGVLKVILELFEGKGGANLARVYLAVDGRRSVTELADVVGVHKGTVSRACSTLYKDGVLEFHDVGGNKVYSKSILERTLHLSRHLQDIANGS